MPDDTSSPELQCLCPYCGGATPDQPRCIACNGLLDPLSRQATQNAMGPWFVRDEQQPHRPGCSYETIVALIARGKVNTESIVRGPTTAQFWYPAKRVPGVANRLGICHACQAAVAAESACPTCHVSFEVEGDRQILGLLPVRLIPGATSDGVQTPAKSVPPTPPQSIQESSIPGVARAAAPRQPSVIVGAIAGIAVMALAGVLISRAAMTQRSSPSTLPSSQASVPATQSESVRGPRLESSGAAGQSVLPPQPFDVASQPVSADVQTPVQSVAPPTKNSGLETLRRTKLP